MDAHRYEIRYHTEETSCRWCGCPLYVGDYAWMDQDEDVFCSLGCAEESNENARIAADQAGDIMRAEIRREIERADCPACNGYGWADGRGHYAATEEGGLLLRCQPCGGTGEVSRA